MTKSTIFVATLLFVLLGLAEPAHARRGVAIFNTGEDIFATGPLPEPFNQEQELQGFEAGYKCSVFGLFWAYFHKWDCSPVVFKDDTYLDDAPLVEAVSKAYSPDDIQMGLWEGHGRWLFGLVGLAAIAGLVLGRDDDDEEASEGEGAPASSSK